MLELSYVVYACIMNNTMWKLETYIYCKLDIHCLIYVYIYIIVTITIITTIIVVIFIYPPLEMCLKRGSS